MSNCTAYFSHQSLRGFNFLFLPKEMHFTPRERDYFAGWLWNVQITTWGFSAFGPKYNPIAHIHSLERRFPLVLWHPSQSVLTLHGGRIVSLAPWYKGKYFSLFPKRKKKAPTLSLYNISFNCVCTPPTLLLSWAILWWMLHGVC
jgi:hypothetical protein